MVTVTPDDNRLEIGKAGDSISLGSTSMDVNLFAGDSATVKDAFHPQGDGFPNEARPIHASIS